MKCTKCGAEIRKGMIFCQSCGTKVEPEQLEAAAAEEKAEAKAKVEASKAAVKDALDKLPGKDVTREALGKMSKGGKLGILAGAVLLVILLFGMLGKKSIDMNKYVTVEFSGYDTVGRAKVEFDYHSFEEDYGEKLKIKSNSDIGNSLLGMFPKSATGVVSLLCDELASLDVNSGLSNGDKVTLSWKVTDKDIKDINVVFNYNLKFKDQTATVKGLEEAELVDPFEGVEVVFMGLAPKGEAEIISYSSNPKLYGLEYKVEPNVGLENGDKVVVSLNIYGMEDVNAYFAESYGMVPSTTEKEFVVEGLGKYAMASVEIPQETLNQMKTQAEDVIQAQAAQKWREGVSLTSVNYCGNYFLRRKDLNNNENINQLYLVYQLTADIKGEREGEEDTVTHFYTLRYDDLIILPDGTCSVDLNDYDGPDNTVRCAYDWGWGEYYYFSGYESLDETLKNCVTSKIDRYTCENNVTAP